MARLLTVRQFAEQFGCSEDAVYRTIKKGGFPFFCRFPALGLRCDLDEFERWVQQKGETSDDLEDAIFQPGTTGTAGLLTDMVAQGAEIEGKKLEISKGQAVADHYAVVRVVEGRLRVDSKSEGLSNDDILAALESSGTRISAARSLISFGKTESGRLEVLRTQ